MIAFDKFIEKYPDENEIDGTQFEKDFPVGFKFTWCDRQKYKIVGYIRDTQFKNKSDFDHMVVFKTWSKYRQRWCYQTTSTFLFYSTWEMMQRELDYDNKHNINKDG